MPLWPVKLREWTGGTIDQIDPLEVLVEFDQPLTFTFRDGTGTLLLTHLVSEGEGRTRYLASPTSEKIIAQLKSGARSIRSALDQPLLWLVDLTDDWKVAQIWSGDLAGIPDRVLPAVDVMLHAYLAPMIRLRATGKSIEPGALPARVVSGLFNGMENAIRLLTNYASGENPIGRPTESHRSLYHLQAQQFAFRSFEVAFRPVDPTGGELIRDPNALGVVRKVENLLTAGLNWVLTGELDAKDDAERQAIFEAIKELSPPQGSPIERIEVSGRVMGDSSPDRFPTLSNNTRQLAGSAVGDLRRGRPLPKYVVQAGRIGEVDRDLRTATIRSESESDIVFHFEFQYFDSVLDAFNTQTAVTTVSTRIENRLRLIFIEPLNDSSSATSD